MSWESSSEYYRLINEYTRERLGGLHSADCLLRSVDFAEIEEMQRDGDWKRAGERLACEASALVAGGAELLVLCTNTMHKVADAITDVIDVPFVHIADTTAHAVRARGMSRVGLLATAYTMEQDFYVGRLRELHDLEVLVPPEADRRLVHDVIYRELCVGVMREESRGSTGGSCAGSPAGAPRRSCSAARRSTCSSGLTIRPCRCSTPPSCTRGGPSSSRSTPLSRPAPRGPMRSHRLPATSRKTATSPYGSLPRLADELDPGLAPALIARLELVDAHEQPDTPGELVLDRSLLAIAVGAREQQPRPGARRPHDDPTLGAPICRGQRRRVLDQLEAEDVDEEPDGVARNRRRSPLRARCTCGSEMATTSGRIRDRRRSAGRAGAGAGSRGRLAKPIRNAPHRHDRLRRDRRDRRPPSTATTPTWAACRRCFRPWCQRRCGRWSSLGRTSTSASPTCRGFAGA